MPYYLSPSLIFEIIAFLASVFFFLRKRDPLVFYFMLFLFVTVCVETVGTIIFALPQFKRSRSKQPMYNVFLIVEFAFYATRVCHTCPAQYVLFTGNLGIQYLLIDVGFFFCCTFLLLFLL
jgi:hypothetical protein